MTSNFELGVKNDSERSYMPPLVDVVTKLFEEIFGSNIVHAEKCVVFNDGTAECPMLIINCSPIAIRTSCSDLEFWAQFVYQFSHELTHYVIRQYKEDKKAHIKWFEETLCEAMSLYIVKLVGERWSECSLSAMNPTFGNSLIDYFSETYQKTSASILAQCSTKDELKLIEENCEANRAGRTIERNYLVDNFIAMPDDINAMVYYPLFMRGDLTVDFQRWENSSVYSSSLVPCLRSIQPAIA